jgi:hypothetical protein
MIKNVIYSVLLIVVGCVKGNDPARPESINLNGEIKNNQSQAIIDSASIILLHSSIGGSIHDTVIYSDLNGKFSIKFSPLENNAYTLQIDKPGFNSSLASVDIDKEFQYLNIVLTPQ